MIFRLRNQLIQIDVIEAVKKMNAKVQGFMIQFVKLFKLLPLLNKLEVKNIFNFQ
jgi:hypothetical protein